MMRQTLPHTEALEKLENFILVNRLAPKTRIPSERDLCEMWGLNRTTLRFAVNMLVEQGMLYRIKGSGTYVAQSKMLRNLDGINSLSNDIRQLGMPFDTRILSLRTIGATKQVAKKLKILLGSRVYECIRLRSIYNIPCILETMYLDSARCPDLDKHYSEKTSIDSILNNIYGVDRDRGEEKISVTYTSMEESELFEIPENTPAFFASGVTFEGEAPIEYYKILFRADCFKFVSRNSKRKM